LSNKRLNIELGTFPKGFCFSDTVEKWCLFIKNKNKIKIKN